MRIIKFLMVLVLIVAMAGCATANEFLRGLMGNSVQVLIDSRKDAISKAFDYDYDTCYAKTEKMLKKMGNASIYAKTKELIAFYYINPNTTPVGVFFKEIDANHTQVEVASRALPAKELVAKTIFSALSNKEEAKGANENNR